MNSKCCLLGLMNSKCCLLGLMNSKCCLLGLMNSKCCLLGLMNSNRCFRVLWEQLWLSLPMLLAPKSTLKANRFDCSAQTRTGMGHLRKPPGVELIPAVDYHLGVRAPYATRLCCRGLFRYKKVCGKPYTPPPHLLSKSGLKLVCNVDIVNKNLMSMRTPKIMPRNLNEILHS